MKLYKRKVGDLITHAWTELDGDANHKYGNDDWGPKDSYQIIQSEVPKQDEAVIVKAAAIDNAYKTLQVSDLSKCSHEELRQIVDNLLLVLRIK